MERERTLRRPGPGGGGGPTDPVTGGPDTNGAEEILAAADRILDSIQPVNAELYLQQNQQRGGE